MFGLICQKSCSESAALAGVELGRVELAIELNPVELGFVELVEIKNVRNHQYLFDFCHLGSNMSYFLTQCV